MARTDQVFQGTPFSVRRGLLRNLILLILLTCGAILAFTLRGAYQAVDELSRSLIERSAVATEKELERFFVAVRKTLRVSAAWAREGRLDPRRRGPNNALLRPLLEQYPQISSAMVAAPSGAGYLLLRKGEAWVNRLVDVEERGSLTLWSRWKNDGSPGEEWQEDLDYDPRSRPWFQGAMQLPSEGEIHWTEPYTFFTTKQPGLTASTRVTDAEGRTLVIGLDVLLADISRFTADLRISENGKVIVLTEDGKVIGLPGDLRYATAEELEADMLSAVHELRTGGVAQALDCWKAEHESTNESFPFEDHGAECWAGFRPFSLDGKTRFWIGVMVPEGDFLGEVDSRSNTIIFISLLALAGAIAMALAMDRALRRRVRRAVERARQLGQYTLEEKIGDGGMGSVYRARHSMLRRPTAVKLLRPDRAESEKAMLRFEHEVQLTSRLTHPNTIAIYDYGRTPEGVFYYAMEFLDGISLEKLVVREGPLPPARLIHVLKQVCGSLEESHSVGLIHRDVKPANIMLCERGGLHDFAKVLDFGLVKDIGADRDVALSEANTLTGTPYYMSPEAIRTPARIDARSDLYSLGAVAYYLATGTRVFDAEGVIEVCSMHLEAEPVAPSTRLGKELPADLEGIILACLEKDPERRPRSAADLAARLSRCEDAGRWSWDDARRWWEENAGLLSRAAASDGKSLAEKPTLDVDLGERP